MSTSPSRNTGSLCSMPVFLPNSQLVSLEQTQLSKRVHSTLRAPTCKTSSVVDLPLLWTPPSKPRATNTARPLTPFEERGRACGFLCAEENSRLVQCLVG